jgi:photosystem II stability/assembly factor-like uncharacterized protein
MPPHIRNPKARKVFTVGRILAFVIPIACTFSPFAGTTGTQNIAASLEATGRSRIPTKVEEPGSATEAGMTTAAPHKTTATAPAPKKPSPTPSATPTNVLAFPVIQQFGTTSYYLKDVDFVDEKTGWAVGAPHWDQTLQTYVGTMIKSSDGGATWIAQKVDTLEMLRKVDFIDAQNGWAVGTNGTILHTSDGGAGWERQSIETQDEFRGVSFVNTREGWAASFHGTQYDDFLQEDVGWQGSIWHTTDGGKTWVAQAIPENASLLNGIQFLDPLHGWAVGVKDTGEKDSFDRPVHSGVVYGTTDGGQTWKEIYSADPNIDFSSVEWIDENTGWVAAFPTSGDITGGCMFRTTDGGKTWQRGDPQCMGGQVLWNMRFIDSRRGYAVGVEYMGAWGPPVYRTMDGGQTWTEIRMDKHEEGQGLFGVSLSGDRVVLVGDQDFLARSDQAWEIKNCGSKDDFACYFNQTYLNPHYTFYDVNFTDDRNGWVVGAKNFSPSQWGKVILHTSDGGKKWEIQYEREPGPNSLFGEDKLESVYFTNPQNGWATGGLWNFDAHDAILHTADGGKTWDAQGKELEGTGVRLEYGSVRFLDSTHGWALAKRSALPSDDPAFHNIFLVRTTDGGRHWTWVNSGVAGTDFDYGWDFPVMLSFPDAQHGWAGGGRYDLIATSDGGTHWVRQKLICANESNRECIVRVFAVSFFDDQIGWVAGEGAFHTTDGGTTWNKADIPIEGEVRDIQFVRKETGMLVSDFGEIMYSADEGAEWDPVGGGFFYPLYALAFLNSGKCWIVGAGGTILLVEASV